MEAAMTSTLRLLFSLIFVGVLSTVAHADDGAIPPEKSQGSVTFVSGGIGKDESEMKRAASRYSMSIEMASTASGRAEYVSDVKVDIRDSRGTTVLSTTGEGPFLLVNLPPGQYTVTAARNGKSQERKVAAGGGAHPRVMFSFP
jgi:hypothetical protein